MTVEYKGKKYRLLHVVETNFGPRAKIAFPDSGRTFWVDTTKEVVAAYLEGDVKHIPQKSDDDVATLVRPARGRSLN